MKLPAQAPGFLRVEESEGYGLKPLPAAKDEQIASWLENAGAEGFAVVGEPHWPVLRVFAERMASLAVRRRDLGLLRSGLKALALAGLGESRDTLTILPLFLHAAETLGADPAELFREAGVGTSKAAQALEGFLGRSPEDRSLAAMGYVATRDEDGFRYLRTW